MPILIHTHLTLLVHTEVAIRFLNSSIEVVERNSTVAVCVELVGFIERPVNFSVQTLNGLEINNYATAGNDYIVCYIYSKY